MEPITAREPSGTVRPESEGVESNARRETATGRTALTTPQCDSDPRDQCQGMIGFDIA